MKLNRIIILLTLFVFLSKATCHYKLPFETYIGENQKRYFNFKFSQRSESISGFAVCEDRGEKELPEIMWGVEAIGAYKKRDIGLEGFLVYYGEDFPYEGSKVVVPAKPLDKGKEYYITLGSGNSGIEMTRYYFTH